MMNDSLIPYIILDFWFFLISSVVSLTRASEKWAAEDSEFGCQLYWESLPANPLSSLPLLQIELDFQNSPFTNIYIWPSGQKDSTTRWDVDP